MHALHVGVLHERCKRQFGRGEILGDEVIMSRAVPGFMSVPGVVGSLRRHESAYKLAALVVSTMMSPRLLLMKTSKVIHLPFDSGGLFLRLLSGFADYNFLSLENLAV